MATISTVGFSTSAATARDFYVRESGRDSKDGRTPRNAWATLERVFQEQFAPGDTVYVGGGVYEVQQVITVDGAGASNDQGKKNKQGKNKGKGKDKGKGKSKDQGKSKNNRNSNSDTQTTATTVTLIGDSTGRFTGDRGPVVVSPKNDGWCFAFRNFGTVAFDGFEFATPTRARKVGNGISAAGAGSRLSFSNCSFSRMDTAVVVQQGEVIIDTVTFDDVTTGVLTHQSQLCEIRNCQFTGIGDWAISSDAEQTTIEQVSLAGQNGIRIGENSTPPPILTSLGLSAVDLALQIAERHAIISNASVTETSYGLFVEQLDSLDVSSFEVTGCTEWGVYATGRELSLTDSLIHGGANGVCLNGTTSAQLATVADTTISEHTTYGLLLNGVSCNLDTSRNTTIRDNGSFGLGVIGADLTLNSSADFALTGNGYGIYSAQGNLDVSGLTLTGNTYGISQTGGQLVCRDVTITGSGTGLQQTNGTSCIIERTTVVAAREWGIHLLNEAPTGTATVALREVSVSGGANGVYANLPAGTVLTLTDSELSGHGGHGLLSWNAGVQIQQATITDNQTGIQHADGPLSIQDSVVSRNAGIGLSVAGVNASARSSLVARRNQFAGNQRAVSAWNVNSAAVLNNLITSNSYGLLTQTTAGFADAWNNTLVDNEVGIYHGGGYSMAKNNIVVYGDGTVPAPNTVGIYDSRQGTLVHGSNLLFGQATRYRGTEPGIGDVVKPPRFVNYARADFRLAKGSPAINAGTSTGGLITRDLAGVSRPMFDAFEIGAYEYPEKDGSLRIINWSERATPPQELLKSLLN